ncbi:MAG TPA: GNAT family N-acetyltransferase [Acidimicrobiia bacterium]|nr:GNAT family N-acetyltransferase [Acidimicrobiia bacterium]
MAEIRNLIVDDIDLFRARLSRGFGRDLDSDPESRSRFDAIFELDRTFAAYDGSDIVGTAAAFSLGLTVPGGGSVPMGGTTIVSVQPTHRRQGVMRGLMTRHLEEVREHGDPVAGLWASESSIYRRFGFGPATHRFSAEMLSGRVDFLEPADPGGIRLAEREEAEKAVRSVYETARSTTPGMLTRGDEWWDYRVFADVESWRGGKSALRYAIYEADGEPHGYAMYRQKAKWDDYAGDGEVSIQEIVTTDPDSHRGLWSYLTSIDLFPNVEYWNLPLDDPLPAMLRASRAVKLNLGDSLWVRLIDVGRAIEARSFADDGVVTFEVADPVFADAGGVFRLVVEGGEASCERVTSSPELELSADALGTLYLGGGDAIQLARAGRISGGQGPVTTLHRMFRGDIQPWCNEIF